MATYTKEEIFIEIKALLVNFFDAKESAISLDTNVVKDLDFDSIDIVDMIVEFNKKIPLSVTAADFKNVKTLGDVVEIFFTILNK